MGQKQILIAILVTLIVGIATVVAVNTFSETAKSANLDAVRNDLITLAASAKTYYLKPVVFGGGGNNFDNISLEGFAVPGTVNEAGDELTNENGTYTIEASAGDTLTIRGVPSNKNSPALEISNVGSGDMEDFTITQVTSSE